MKNACNHQLNGGMKHISIILWRIICCMMVSCLLFQGAVADTFIGKSNATETKTILFAQKKLQTKPAEKAKKVVLVEYFDYNCPVCRAYFPVIAKLREREPEVKIIQRVVPVLAPSSVFIDKVMLASRLQGKFSVMQQAILEAKNPETIPPRQVVAIAKANGLNISALKQDFQNPKINAELKKNLQEFMALGQTQIPVIVIYAKGQSAHQIILVGAKPLQQLQAAIYAVNAR